MSEYPEEELKILLAFHKQYPGPDNLRSCYYCHLQKLITELSQVPVQVDEYEPSDEHTIFIDVCPDCIQRTLPIKLADYEQNLLA